MREVALDGLKFKLNGKTIFLRTVLDQGFYPDGIYTAKSDDDLKKDILISKAAGFHGARLHQKVFEKRFIYHCDKEGYIVWGEHANWGMDYTDAIAQGNFICEWTEIIERDFNSPAIIGWCPFNETWGYHEKNSDARPIESVYRITKLYDNTRPCIATSGNYHINKMEIYDVHDYMQSTEGFEDNYAHIAEGVVNDQVERNNKGTQPYHGEPIFVSEYGGIKWVADDPESGWGYGQSVTTPEEFMARLKGLTDVLLDHGDIFAFCYTQLTDVEQEKNGLLTYDRKFKFPAEKYREIFSRKSVIED